MVQSLRFTQSSVDHSVRWNGRSHCPVLPAIKGEVVAGLGSAAGPRLDDAMLAKQFDEHENVILENRSENT